MTIVFLNYPNENPQNYFKIQRTVLKLFGVSFDGYKNYAYTIYSILWLLSILLTNTVIELYEVYVYINNIDTVVNILSYIGTDVLGVIKIAVLLYYSKEIREMLDGLEKGVFYPNQKRGGKIETDLVKKCIIINNRQTFIYYFTVVAVCGIGCFGTMITRIFFGHKELPFMPFSWFDASESPYYEIVWFYQTYWRTSYALMVSSTDSLIAGILLHISTQCKILQNAVKRVIENAYNEAFGNNKSRSDDIDPSKIPWNILEKHIKLIINYHGDVIGLADKFEKLFSLLLLCVFAATLFILCFIMYHASLFDLISMRAAQDFSYVGVVTVQVFLYCFWGNEVRDESVKIADACWETNFVGTDVRFQKALASIIRRSQKPIVITAGKFSDLSLKSYVWLIRASYSYYMVLGNRQKKELEITL